MGGNKDNALNVVSEIVNVNPDVVLINTTLILDIAVKLEPYGIPVVSGGGLEMEDSDGEFIFVDNKGYPITNLTGTFTMPLDHLENTFKLLSQIAPIEGKKVAFATLPSPAFTEKKVKSALNKVGLELKEYREFIYFDDYKDFVLQNNNANDVGWIINGEPIISRKDDRDFTREDVYTWENKFKKKPGAGFWELEVQLGTLCALAIDSMTTVSQMLNMADRIIRGEKLSSIKPENPGKTLILVNQKKAIQYGLEIPMDLYNISWRVYTDYSGNYIGHE